MLTFGTPTPWRRRFERLLLCGLLGLAACTSHSLLPSATAPVPASAELDTTYAALQATGGTLFKLDPASSTVRIYAFRAGKARQFGHNHVLSAPAFTGYLFLPVDVLAGARFDLQFRLDALAFDDPAQRQALGGSFTSPIAPALIDSTREHMLGEFNFQADRFPEVRIHSLEITGEAPKFAARITVELHGQQRELWLPLTVHGLPGTLAVEGALVLSQSDFGIRPYSALGGLLAVQDQVIVEFTLLGENVTHPSRKTL